MRLVGPVPLHLACLVEVIRAAGLICRLDEEARESLIACVCSAVREHAHACTCDDLKRVRVRVGTDCQPEGRALPEEDCVVFAPSPWPAFGATANFTPTASSTANGTAAGGRLFIKSATEVSARLVAPRFSGLPAEGLWETSPESADAPDARGQAVNADTIPCTHNLFMILVCVGDGTGGMAGAGHQQHDASLWFRGCVTRRAGRAAFPAVGAARGTDGVMPEVTPRHGAGRVVQEAVDRWANKEDQEDEEGMGGRGTTLPPPPRHFPHFPSFEGTCGTSPLVPPSLPRTMTKGDKTHGGFRGESKLKYWSRGLKKKSAEEKLASPFNVFMRTELERLKKVCMHAGACALL